MHICNPSPPETQEEQHEARTSLGWIVSLSQKSQDQAEQLSSIAVLSALVAVEVLWLPGLFVFTFLFVHVFCVHVHLGIYVSVLPSVSQGSNLGH